MPKKKKVKAKGKAKGKKGKKGKKKGGAKPRTVKELVADTKEAEAPKEDVKARAVRIRKWRAEMEVLAKERESVMKKDAKTHKSMHSHHRASRIRGVSHSRQLADEVQELRLASTRRPEVEREMLLLQRRTTELRREIASSQAAWAVVQNEMRVGMSSLRLTVEQETHSEIERIRTSLLADAHAEFEAIAADAVEWNEQHRARNYAIATRLHHRMHAFDARAAHLHQLEQQVGLVDGEATAQEVHLRKLEKRNASHRALVRDLHASIAQMSTEALAADAVAEEEGLAPFLAPGCTLAQRSAAAEERSRAVRTQLELSRGELRNWRFRALRAVRILEGAPAGGWSRPRTSAARPRIASPLGAAARARRPSRLAAEGVDDDPLGLSRPARDPAKAKAAGRARTLWLRQLRPQTPQWAAERPSTSGRPGGSPRAAAWALRGERR